MFFLFPKIFKYDLGRYAIRLTILLNHVYVKNANLDLHHCYFLNKYDSYFFNLLIVWMINNKTMMSNVINFALLRNIWHYGMILI